MNASWPISRASLLIIDDFGLKPLRPPADDQGVRDTLGKQGWELASGSPQALRQLIDEETARYEKVIRDGGIQIDQL